MKHLKPCPFCGSAAAIDSNVKQTLFGVYCTGCRVELGTFSAPKDAARAWNIRDGLDDEETLLRMVQYLEGALREAKLALEDL